MKKYIAIVIALLALQPVKTIHGTVDVVNSEKAVVVVEGGTIIVDKTEDMEPGYGVLVYYLWDSMEYVKGWR